MNDEEGMGNHRNRSKGRQGSTTAIELVVAVVFLIVFTGAAIGMSRLSAGMGAPGIFQLVPLGMAGVGVLMIVATLVRIARTRQMAAELEEASARKERVDALELETREAELKERLRRAVPDSVERPEPIICAYCGASRGVEEPACGGCGAKRS